MFSSGEEWWLLLFSTLRVQTFPIETLDCISPCSLVHILIHNLHLRQGTADLCGKPSCSLKFGTAGNSPKFQCNVLHLCDVCTVCVAASFIANVSLLSQHRCCSGITNHCDHSVKGLFYYLCITACIWQCLEEPGPGAQGKPLVQLISGSTFTQACRSKWNSKCCLLRTPTKNDPECFQTAADFDHFKQ